jgi:hypothetical protein
VARDVHGTLVDLEHVVDRVVADELIEDAIEHLAARHPPQAQGRAVSVEVQVDIRSTPSGKLPRSAFSNICSHLPPSRMV